MEDMRTSYLNKISQVIISTHLMSDDKRNPILEKIPVDFETKTEEELEKICLDIDNVITK